MALIVWRLFFGAYQLGMLLSVAQTDKIGDKMSSIDDRLDSYTVRSYTT
jgi:hypothetical protein